MPDGKKVDLTIKLDPEYRARLEILRERLDRSLGWLIERCIESHLPDLEAGEPLRDRPGPPAPSPTPTHYGPHKRKPKA